MSEDDSNINRHFYCTEAAIPIRSSPDESSEMISQLIYGDFAHYLSKENSWTQIKADYDGYEGWVDSKMLTPLESDGLPTSLEWKWVKDASLSFAHAAYAQRLPIGSRVAFSKDHEPWDPRSATITLSPDSEFFTDEELTEILNLSTSFMYVPYLWGGCSSFGIDCSGFTQRVYRMMGKKLPRDSRPQEKLGQKIEWGKQQRGDLAFFSKPNQFRITHVGMLVEEDKIIHASGHVRIDTLTSIGIIHSEKQTLTHELISIKR